MKLKVEQQIKSAELNNRSKNQKLSNLQRRIILNELHKDQMSVSEFIKNIIFQREHCIE